MKKAAKKVIKKERTDIEVQREALKMFLEQWEVKDFLIIMDDKNGPITHCSTACRFKQRGMANMLNELIIKNTSVSRVE